MLVAMATISGSEQVSLPPDGPYTPGCKEPSMSSQLTIPFDGEQIKSARKRCPRCGVFKPADLIHFPSQPKKSKGIHCHCRECHRRDGRDYYRRHRALERKTSGKCWEVDWSHPANVGGKYMARNPKGHLKSSREWHLVDAGRLRLAGINTPVYRADSWEVDWEQRQGKKVLARNLRSKMPQAREWHWVDFGCLQRVGIPWKPKRPKTGRHINANGYVLLSKSGMTQEEIDIATKHDLFLGAKKQLVTEHQLVAAMKYNCSLKGMVVRHLNGIKSDNNPNNLVLGTTQENTMDHNTARLQTMYWRDRCEIAERKLAQLES